MSDVTAAPSGSEGSGSTVSDVDVLVVGAGVSGLLAALEIASAGRSVTVVDKGRGVGGRLATRRLGPDGPQQGRADHGAQFFTVRTERFDALVQPLVADGLVREWTRGFGAEEDGHPRYSVTDGMTALAKQLAARVVDAGGVVRTGCRLRSIDPDGRAVAEPAPDGTTAAWQAERVVITSPVPQSIELLGAEAPMELGIVTYEPTLCLLGLLDGPGDVADALGTAGAQQRPEGTPFEFVADNRAKGASAVPALTAHLTGAESAARWDDPDEATLAFLLDSVAPLLGPVGVSAPLLKRWRYATPTTLHPDPCLVDGRLVFAGDAFGTPRVEGAATSGWAAAEVVLEG